MRRPCTWAEAEKYFPGVGAEWDVMVARPELFDGPGPGSHGPVDEVTLELQEIQPLYSPRLALVVTQVDAVDRWHHAPCWIRSVNGCWSSPLPMPKAMFSRELIEYRVTK